MIQSKTACTYEIDDTGAAVREILSQLEPLALTADMAGIVLCSYDFIETGVVAALAAALPFELVGETTISQAVHGEAGLLELTLMVLYADDCRFAGGVSDPIPDSGDMNGAIEAGYREAAARLGEKEKLIVAFPPLLNGQAGDDYVSLLSRLSGRVPIFGSICADDNTSTYENAHTIYRGRAYKDRMTFLMVSGSLSPEFRIASVSGESRLPYKGEITASNGNLLMGINDVSTVDYLETIGLAQNGKIRSGISSIPFLISFEDESGANDVPVARALFMTTEENYAVCGGRMPVGAGITVGICSTEDVLSTTREMIADLSRSYPGRAALIFSCLGRRLALGADPLLEVRIAAGEMSPSVSFMMGYSGGELCPTSVSADGATNRFHNYTIVACIL